MIVLKKVLVATDFSEPSDAALAYGRELAFTFGAQLVVAHVAENTLTRGFGGGDGFVFVDPALQRSVEARAHRQLETLISDEDREQLCAAAVVLTSNAPAHAITEYRERSRGRSHRPRHAWTRRGSSIADGQRRRTGGAHGAVPRAHRAAPRTRVRPGGCAGRIRRGVAMQDGSNAFDRRR